MFSGAPDDFSGVYVMVFHSFFGCACGEFRVPMHTFTGFRVLTPFGCYIIKWHPRGVEYGRGKSTGGLNIVLGPGGLMGIIFLKEDQESAG